MGIGMQDAIWFVSEWNQYFWMDLLNECFNDLLIKSSDWILNEIIIFEPIGWLNDSMTHSKTVTCHHLVVSWCNLWKDSLKNIAQTKAEWYKRLKLPIRFENWLLHSSGFVFLLYFFLSKRHNHRNVDNILLNSLVIMIHKNLPDPHSPQSRD